jgi:hypothetical protein
MCPTLKSEPVFLTRVITRRNVREETREMRAMSRRFIEEKSQTKKGSCMEVASQFSENGNDAIFASLLALAGSKNREEESDDGYCGDVWR